MWIGCGNEFTSTSKIGFFTRGEKLLSTRQNLGVWTRIICGFTLQGACTWHYFPFPLPPLTYLLNSKGSLTRGAIGSGSSHINPLNLSPTVFFSDFPVSLSSQLRFGFPDASKSFLVLLCVVAAVNKLLLVFILKSFKYNFQSYEIAQTQRIRVTHPKIVLDKALFSRKISNNLDLFLNQNFSPEIFKLLPILIMFFGCMLCARHF